MAYWQFGKITLLGAGTVSPRTAKLKGVCKKATASVRGGWLTLQC